eukprot:Hpha_TRINITY_DN15888_c1_g10::TRINITY_DN15888_c1_g10_i1::g.188882::m.188882
MRFDCQGQGSGREGGLPGGFPRELLTGLASVAWGCGAVQVCLLLIFPALRRSKVRVVLGLIAAAGVVSNTWWMFRDPAGAADGMGGYEFSLVCGGGQLQLLLAEVCAGWWTVLLGIYSAVWAHYTNTLAAVPPAVDVVFFAAGVILPFAELITPTLAAGVDCPRTVHERSSVAGAFSFFAFAHIFGWVVCAGSVTVTWLLSRFTRKGCPRLWVLPLTCIAARGLWPLIWVTGWFGDGGCADAWLPAWGIIAALQAPTNLLMFFSNTQTLRTARQEPACCAEGCGRGGGEEGDRLYPREEEVDEETPLDVLWGSATGVEFVLVPSPKHRVEQPAHQIQDPCEGGSSVTFATTHLGGTLSDPGAILQLQTPSGGIHSPPPIRSASIQGIQGVEPPTVSPKKSTPAGAEWLAPAVVGGLNQDPNPQYTSRTLWSSGAAKSSMERVGSP